MVDFEQLRILRNSHFLYCAQKRNNFCMKLFSVGRRIRQNRKNFNSLQTASFLFSGWIKERNWLVQNLMLSLPNAACIYAGAATQLVWSHELAGDDDIVGSVSKVLRKSFSGFVVFRKHRMFLHGCFHMLYPAICGAITNIVICMSSDKSSVFSFLLSVTTTQWSAANVSKRRHPYILKTNVVRNEMQATYLYKSGPPKVWTKKRYWIGRQRRQRRIWICCRLDENPLRLNTPIYSLDFQ